MNSWFDVKCILIGYLILLLLVLGCLYIPNFGAVLLTLIGFVFLFVLPYCGRRNR